MKVITEERLIELLESTSRVTSKDLLRVLIYECQELDTLTVSKLRTMSDATIIDEPTWDNFIKEVPLNYEGHTIKVGDNYYKSTGGKWVTQITWTNCADEMPPDDFNFKLIVRSADGTFLSDGAIVNEWREEAIPENHIWTIFTQGKWEHLNK